MKYIKLLIAFTVLPFAAYWFYGTGFVYVEQHAPEKQVDTQIFETSCGGRPFRVLWLRDQGLMNNNYELQAFNKGKWEHVWSAMRDTFYAACLTSASRKQYMVVQNYCNLSWCPEGWYFAFETNKLKAVLEPKFIDYHNINEATLFLGYTVPNLAEYKGTICCRKPKDSKAQKQ